MDCGQCKELQEQSYWGCGVPGEFVYNNYSNNEAPYNRICPRWYAKTIFVNDIMENLVDYKRAALGNVRQDISDAELTYLRLAELENVKWENAQNEETTNKG